MAIDKATIQAYTDRIDDYRGLVKDIKNPDLEKFITTLPEAGKVLDAGAGPGKDALKMRAAGLQVTALEPTPEFADLIEASGIPLIRQDFDGIPETGEYDGVWASFSLLHVERNDCYRHIQQIHNALKPGGLLVLGMKLGEGAKRDPLGRYYCYYSEQELLSMLSSTGFEVLHQRTGSAKGLAGEKEPFIYLTAKR